MVLAVGLGLLRLSHLTGILLLPLIVAHWPLYFLGRADADFT
jgi:hypothetical protein